MRGLCTFRLELCPPYGFLAVFVLMQEDSILLLRTAETYRLCHLIHFYFVENLSNDIKQVCKRDDYPLFVCINTNPSTLMPSPYAFCNVCYVFLRAK